MSEIYEPRDPVGTDRPETVRLHPAVYGTMIALAIIYVLAAWAFAGTESTAYLIVVVTGLFGMGVGLSLIMLRMWRKYHSPEQDQPDDHGDQWTFREWAADWFQGPRGREKGLTAAVEALAPIAAVAVGMVVLELAVHLFSS